MKLLIYSHYFAPSIGGVESIVQSLAAGLAECRSSNDEKEFDVTVVTQTSAGDFADRTLPFLIVRQPSYLRLLGLVRSADVLHLAGPALAPLSFGLLAGKPVVVEHHGYQAICPNGLLLHQPDTSVCPGHFQAKRYRKCLACDASHLSRPASLRSLLTTLLRHALSKRVSTNIAITEHVQQRLTLPHSRVIYHGVPDPQLGKNVPGAASGASAPLRFAYVGRLVREKGPSVLLAAACQLRDAGFDFQVNFVGDGPERQLLEETIRSTSLAHFVSFMGFLRGEALRNLLSTISVIVMPSIGEETAGLAVMEQMMNGRLVIVADIGGMAEVVGDAGLKFPPGDAQALAKCMRRVFEEPGLVSGFGAKARARSLELFRLQRMIEDHRNLYCGMRKGSA